MESRIDQKIPEELRIKKALINHSFHGLELQIASLIL